ncbi:MAG TPA: hypothetical protein VF266_12710 [Thermoanaerobaculia bacterium]
MIPSAWTRHPLLSFIALCDGITWTVRFTLPLVTSEWTVLKICIGIGVGPGTKSLEAKAPESRAVPPC